MTCGHTFHTCCISDKGGNSLGCPICLGNLKTDVQKLSDSWNKRLLSGIENDGCGGNDDDDGGDDDDDDGDESPHLEKPKERDQKYFKSSLFIKNIEEKVEKIKSTVNSQLILSHEE